MAFSRIVQIGNGSTNIFTMNFTLGYLSDKDITCRVGTEVDGLGNPVYRTITYLGDNLVRISGAPPALAKEVVFERTTLKTGMAVSFSDGDTMDEVNLDIGLRQAILLVHEVLDGRFSDFNTDISMGGFRIHDLGAPLAATDAANKQYIDDRIATGAANAATATAGAVTATSQAGIATTQAAAAAADRIKTGQDRTAVASDAATVNADKGIVLGYKNTVATDRTDVATNKATVNTDKGIVAADKATVASDKGIVLGYRTEVEASRAEVAANKATVSTDKGIVAADKATVAADKALVAADKATVATNTTLAQKWASNPEGTIVTGALYSALHYAAKAAASAGTVISGLAGLIHGATAKPALADADELVVSDSASSWGLKKLTWGTLKDALGKDWSIGIAQDRISFEKPVYVTDKLVLTEASGGTMSKGVAHTVTSAGTVATTFTPNINTHGHMVSVTMNGASTINAPAANCSMVVVLTYNGVGSMTLAGFSKTAGDKFATTAGTYMIVITKAGTYPTAFVTKVA